MNNENGGYPVDQDDILVGLGLSTVSPPYHTEHDVSSLNYYSHPQNAPFTAQTEPSTAHGWHSPQDDRIRARLAETQLLTNNFTQVFSNDGNGGPYQDGGPQMVSDISHFAYYENDIDQRQVVQGNTIFRDTSFGGNSSQHNTVSGVSPDEQNKSSHSHLNVLATPFIPQSFATSTPDDPGGQSETYGVTGRPLQSMEAIVEQNIAPCDPVMRWSPSGAENNGYDACLLGCFPYNSTPALFGVASGQFPSQPSMDGILPSSGTQQAAHAPYTQYIDNGPTFRGGMLNSPHTPSLPSQVSTSISGPSSQTDYTLSSLSLPASVRQSRNARSRMTGRGHRRAPALSRSASAHTSGSYDTTASGPVRRGGRNGPMDPMKNKQAQNTRIQKTVCASCKLRKVACIRQVESDSCDGCKKDGSACVNHYFAHGLKESPAYHFGQFLINSAMIPEVNKPFLTEKIDFASSISCLASCSQDYKVRIQSEPDLWVELDLLACQDHWQQAKLDYNNSGDLFSVEDFVTDKQKWQETVRWRNILLVPREQQEAWDNPLEAIGKLDRMSGRAKYFLVPKSGGTFGIRLLNHQNGDERRLCFIAMLTFERIRHSMELAAYSCLEEKLTLAKPTEKVEAVQYLGRMLLSLRRRIAVCRGTKIWHQFQHGVLAEYLGEWKRESFYPPAIRSVVEFCFQLYIHFFCRYDKMGSAARHQAEENQAFIHPYSGMHTKEYWPTDGSRDGFNQWMEEGAALFRTPVRL